MQKVENIRQRKAMLLSQRNIYAVICRGCLQFKVERHTETLAESESPGFVYARAERCMHNQLHASAFIKKALGNHGIRGGDSAQNGPASHNVFNGLFGAGIVQPALALEPFHSVKNFRRFLINKARYG